jgi:hypothetical protein
VYACTRACVYAMVCMRVYAIVHVSILAGALI